MGAGSVTAPATPAAALAPSSTTSWRLAPDCAADTQGLVVSPFAHLEAGEALFLKLPGSAGGGWLTPLRAQIPITDATGQVAPCAAIAFTHSGLAAMGLDAAALATFAQPFTQGMQQPDRQRRLRDQGLAVISDGLLWSGDAADGAAVTVHAVLLLYAVDDAALDRECAKAEAILTANRIAVVRRQRLSLRFDERGIAREHFGFADGVSQPVPFGPEILDASGAPAPKDPWHGVAAGDILLGHINADGEPAPGPLVKVAAGAACPLPQNDAPEGFRDLGFNGSYLVVRELRQAVAAFWNSMDASAQALQDPVISSQSLAERVVGRTFDGAPLSPGGPLPPSGGQPANAFGFIQRDPDGFGCPMGAHIRRGNPRDGLARDVADGPDLLKAANNHRLLRRGRKFGTDVVDPRVDDGVERGLLFMCLNTDLERQFEFVQQNWILNANFAVLFDETDPLLGPKGTFTIPETPVRRRAGLETFVQLVGGEYFFLPSLPALAYLASLAPVRDRR